MRIKTLVQLSHMIQNSPWHNKIRFWGMFVIHRAMTQEVFQLLKATGFIDAQFGIDSGSQRILDRMAKSYKVEHAEDVLEGAWKSGISVHADLIIGFPGETEETIRETMDFLERTARFKWKINTLHTFYIRPGSPVAQSPESFGIDDAADPNEWVSMDGTNDLIWRLRKLKEVYDHARSLGYKIEYDPTHRYYRALANLLYARQRNQELFDLFYEMTDWCSKEIEQLKQQIQAMERMDLWK